MVSRRLLTALLLVQMIAFAVSAQQSAEYARGTGGEIVMTPKGSAPFSGSFELSLSSGGRSPAYGATAGGTLMQDRLWFFASASRQEMSPSRFADLELPDPSSALGARVDGQIGVSQDFSAFFEAARRPELSTMAPSSFLSLRHTGIVSSNMFFSAILTRRSR